MKTVNINVQIADTEKHCCNKDQTSCRYFRIFGLMDCRCILFSKDRLLQFDPKENEYWKHDLCLQLEKK